MEIDLIKIAKLRLNINEYLTLLKIDKNIRGVDFPFTSTQQHLNSLQEAGHIIIDENNDITFTEKGMRVVNPKEKVNFDELFELYPDKTPEGRILRTKNKEISGRLTKDYKFLRDKYLLRVTTNEMHNNVIEATKAMLNDRKAKGSLTYMHKLEYYLNKNGWEAYMDEQGESISPIMSSNNNELL